MQSFDRERSQVFEVAEHLPVSHGKAVEYASCNLSVSLRHGLSCFAAIPLNGLDHAGRVGESGVIRVDERPEPLFLCRVAVDDIDIGRSLVLCLWIVHCLPFLPATFEQPHSADVLEESCGSLDAALVGEVVFKTFFRNDGVLRFDSQERPRTATEIGELLILGRN